MGKQIEITFPNGEVWKLDAQVVVDDRCHRFELMFIPCVQANDNELIAYLQNDMDWIEVMRHVRVKGGWFHPTYDYATMFDDATFAVKAGEG